MRVFHRLHLRLLLLLSLLGFCFGANAATNVTLRVMAANLNGDSQIYGASQIRIFQGLKPDVVAIQEFNYSGNIRDFVDAAFGTNFQYYRENGLSLPNGIISRYPILASGSWADPVQSQPNRAFAWARIDVPGTNDLYVVSVHLLTSSSGNRLNEGTVLKTNILASFPTNAWIVLAGDFNTDSRGEAVINLFTNNFLSDQPVPTDDETAGSPNTNLGRSKPYDYVLTSASLRARLTNAVFASHSYPRGLVFDSRVYPTLSDVAPIQLNDSANGQHMAVLKDFLIGADDPTPSGAPVITAQPQALTVAQSSNASFTVTASGDAPLTYQWRFFGTNLVGATDATFTRTNVQTTDAGVYSVIVSNAVGSAVSSDALLTVVAGPVITTQPQSQGVSVGGSAAFTVAVTGFNPLSYQWRFNSAALGGATSSSYSVNNVQPANGGQYTVVVTNVYGSITSSVATLTVDTNPPGSPQILAGWDASGLATYGPSPWPPTTNAINVSVGGLTRGTGVGTSGTAAGRAWGGNGFDATSAAAAIAANDVATFSLTANAGYRISITRISKFDYRRSGGGPPNGVLQYQVGAGVFTDLANLSYPTTASTGDSLSAINLASIAALQNVSGSTITFRVVNYGASGAGGTWYVYDVGNSVAPDLVVEGTVTPLTPPNQPPSTPVLENPTLNTEGFRLNLNGTLGTNYIVQASTNLADWASLQTNAAPFIFTDTNAGGFSNRYYRAVWRDN